MKSFILGCLLSLSTFLSGVKESTLDDIAKPYLGEYECKKAQIGSLDCLKRFSYIRLELKDEENFTLHYKEKGEKKKQFNGKYAYDKEKGTLTLIEEKGRFEREFPLSDGRLTVSLPVGEKMLVLQFEQK